MKNEVIERYNDVLKSYQKNYIANNFVNIETITNKISKNYVIQVGSYEKNC